MWLEKHGGINAELQEIVKNAIPGMVLKCALWGTVEAMMYIWGVQAKILEVCEKLPLVAPWE